jgi:asparagine synthetase A
MSDEFSEEKLAQLELSRINLRVTPAIFDRLLKIAELKGQTIEEYSEQVLRDSLQGTIGTPIIGGPSRLNGENSVRVTGPSNGAWRTH